MSIRRIEISSARYPDGWKAGPTTPSPPAKVTDLRFPIGTLIAQHLSFPDVAKQFYALVQDVHLLSASLEKLELLGAEPPDRRGLTFLVETEIEYLFVLVRAMYDVLQSVIREIALLLSNSDGKHVVQNLPSSFADMVIRGNPPVYRSADEIADRYNLPKRLANCYVAEAEHFDRIRSIRVGIEHSGRRLPSVYVTERGFAIHAKEPGHWSALAVWKGHELLPNGLGSARALAAFLAKSFLDTLDRFEEAIRRVIDPQRLPVAVSSGNNIFVTNPCIDRLADLSAVLASPWTVR